MKKTLSLLFLFLVSLSLMAQWYGDGLSASTAYYGVINSSYPMQTWNTANYPGGIIYVGRSTSGQNDLEVGTGGILNIGQGITVKFCTISTDLRITGTGVLNANGSSSSYITFTKNAQATWGHVTFEGSTGNSSISYCIFEYGYKNGTTLEGYGGAIQANTSNLAVMYSLFRNNYAQWGGAIFVNTGQGPSIVNCHFYNNQALHGGGGVYCWNNSSSLIGNCLFDGNQVLEPSVSYYTGGGLAGQSGVSIKVVNCTFANNTSYRPEGQALLLHSSPNARVVNCIFWGAPDKQIYCYGTTAAVIIYCGYRGITASSGTPVNSLVLNATNTAPDGPNFVATDGSDWSINFISPCRDKGTDSYAGVIIPTLDYMGNSRISTTDMGTYEVQYSRWQPGPYDKYTWTNPLNWVQGLWPGSSGSTGDVVIPLLSGSSVAPEIGGTIYINSGKYMILEPGAMATFGALTNNGTLLLQSDATNISSLITDTYSGNNATVELFLTGGGTKTTYKWHFISSPVSSLPVSTFSPTYTLDLAQYVESRPTSSTREGWVAYDGYIYSTGGMGGPTFSNLAVGQGYDYFKSADQKYTLSGMLNTGDVTVNLGFSGDSLLNGFNLLGNPFSSGLNWDDIVSGLYNPFPDHTSKSLYFTRDNVQCSYISGVGIPSDVTGIIPPMQGFFSKTYSTGNSITLPALSRSHDAIHPRYKSQTIIPLVRLVFNEDSLSDETVVRFDNKASSGLDIDYDALKFGVDPELPSIYTVSQGKDFAINGQPFPQQDSLILPLILHIVSDSSVNSIKATQIQGLGDYKVKLTDRQTGLTTDLKDNPVVDFTSVKGTISGRFELVVYLITAIDNLTTPENLFVIYQANGLLNIIPRSDTWNGKTGSVKIFDLTGKTVSNLQGVEFVNDAMIQITAPAQPGVYFVEMKSGGLRYVGKVVIR